MVKAWVFGSLVAGAALFGASLYIQTRPLAFTQGGIDVAAEPALATKAPELPSLIEPLGDVRVDPEGARVLEIAPIYITPRPIGHPGENAARPLEPCSDWRDIGPAHVEAGQGLDSRRVRELC
jgi:hypothetical protein